MKLCLLVDDDLDDQEIFIMCLKRVDPAIICETANDGIFAIEKVKDSTYIPHYIFLDVNMPRMDGLTCLEELKKLPHLKDTKIFMYSTTSQKSSVEKSKALGANDFIIKPSKTADLKDKLSKIFEIVSELKN